MFARSDKPILRILCNRFTIKINFIDSVKLKNA